jgi:hypothetical protein
MTHESVSAYLAPDQHERWLDRAEELGMGQSEFVISMVEAGLKKFDAAGDSAESVRELRGQRDHLRDELGRCRDDRQRLEAKLTGMETAWQYSDRVVIEQFVADNPGATFDQILTEVEDTAAVRVSRHLDTLEGNTLRVECGDTEGDRRYFSVEPSGADNREDR